MCLGVTPQRKFGATGTIGGIVVKSVVMTAKMSGTGVGEGIAITGGTERLCCLFRCSLGLEQHMRHVAQACILGVEHGRVHLCGLPNDGIAH
jgi:hypothetical protein